MSNLIYIAYGSESGNAANLAQQLFSQINSCALVKLITLNEVDLSKLTANDTLLIITSSFGNGEAPANALLFHEKISSSNDKLNFKFAIFGLGDISYPLFCGFSITIERILINLGAIPIANRVDADCNYISFFEQWSNAIVKYICHNIAQPLQQLNLQVKAYSEKLTFKATINNIKRINKGDFPVFDIDINIKNSGINYQAGDLLYILPPANKICMQRLQNFYGKLNTAQIAELSKKELRLINKTLIRALIKITANKELKRLTKISANAELMAYLKGRDVADLLQDFFTASQITIDDLLEILPMQLPRAYSIASSFHNSPNNIRLCVREVNYILNGNHYIGTASNFLATSAINTNVNIYIRANDNFHLPIDDRIPIIMIASGTGIAPYLGFLSNNRRGESYLFFGERHREKDFLYYDELQYYLNNGNLTQLYCAFSRDQSQKIYVQDILAQQGKLIWKLLQQDAQIYICGNKNNLGRSIDEVLSKIAIQYANLSENEAQQWLQQLIFNKRFHKDLY